MFRLRDEALLYSQPREGEQDPGQQVHVDLEKSKRVLTDRTLQRRVDFTTMRLVNVRIGSRHNHTWLLMLLLSPNTNHPPTQAARKA